MKNEMKENALEAKNDMKEMRGEMQRIGRGLQVGTAGIMAMARSETRAVELKMAAPRGGVPEPTGESVDCVGPTVEDKLIRETCWTRLVTAERVTVTEREKLNGETETCKTRHEVTTAEIIMETREIKNEVTEITETREIEETEDEVEEIKDEHTHTWS